MKKIFKNFDFTLIFAPLVLTAFGVIMIYSASMVYGVVKFDVPSTYYLTKQIQWVVLGLIAFVITMFFPYQKYQKLMPLIIFFVLSTLVLVLIVGSNKGNANSWFDFGPVSFQPAEAAKIGLIMYLASVLSKKQAYIQDFTKAVLPPIALTIAILALIGIQPDIGTAAIIFLMACAVIISSGIRFRHIFLLGITGAICIILALPKMTSDERIARFTGAYQPFQLPESDGYHLIQSYIAIGTGGLTGEGLGQSVQKLGYLLEPHTDFIMAVVAEELGVLGVLITLGLMALIVLRGLYVARKCKDGFGSLLAIGISSMIGIQAFINLGAISGILPITGVPLPFVSYGGSSLIVLLASMGILNNVAKQAKLQEDYTFTKQAVDEDMENRKTTTNSATQPKGGQPWVNTKRSIRS
ncbi:cell division protein FtsW [Pontibacillus yanchengensis]|uniref:Cell division protein FtsW n=2 Tax=Pontibacillus yanchengensis TaxID=462910 RepID=A0ACC7VB63_9BACI|nr:FtsW/RodA/SpoVE family cell cycle protein [Pontibacillus yanchengensis]MYL32999.1 cell division protein FtsW [Pontibacillus yanchengensis]MYL52151.1 cell division protein FtsW [Pontibacillus yanchengensis]